MPKGVGYTGEAIKNAGGKKRERRKRSPIAEELKRRGAK